MWVNKLCQNIWSETFLSYYFSDVIMTGLPGQYGYIHSESLNTSFFSLRFLRWWASASCEEAESSLEYSRIRLSIAPFTIWSRRFVSSSRTSSSSSSLGSSPVWGACIGDMHFCYIWYLSLFTKSSKQGNALDNFRLTWSTKALSINESGEEHSL